MNRYESQALNETPDYEADSVEFQPDPGRMIRWAIGLNAVLWIVIIAAVLA